MNKKNSQGFTLIELLVVVAIIGILAAIVMSNLNSARVKGVDAAIKATLANARSQAAIFYDNGQVFTNVCTDAGGISEHVLSAAQKLGTTADVEDNTQDFVYDITGLPAADGDAVCHDSDTAWAAAVSLKNPGTASSGWCVDSTGAAKEVTSLDAGVTACP